MPDNISIPITTIFRDMLSDPILMLCIIGLALIFAVIITILLIFSEGINDQHTDSNACRTVSRHK
jgi:hypothetical protein